MINRILDFIALFLALIVVLPIHEYAHALVAYKCGDDTPKLMGRLTINPMAHFDPIGLVIFVFARFGWAKPVPINPYNFRKQKLHSFFVSIAGVLANYILAFVAYPLYVVSVLYIPQFGYFTDVLSLAFYYMFLMSLNFIIFNLLPLYPLDGFRAMDSFLKKKGKFYWWLKKYSIYILYGLFGLSILADITNFYYIDILGYVISFGAKILGAPITALWGLIL